MGGPHVQHIADVALWMRRRTADRVGRVRPRVTVAVIVTLVCASVTLMTFLGSADADTSAVVSARAYGVLLGELRQLATETYKRLVG